MEDNLNSVFVTHTPSFLEGFGSVLDMFGTQCKFRNFKSGAEADASAIANDWEHVGNDMRTAMNGFDETSAD